jgi:hypothetical protein
VQWLVLELERHGFVQRVAIGADRFRYQPASEELDRMLAELGALYERRRVAVITQIYSNPVRKVQTFADAFRLRREE